MRLLYILTTGRKNVGQSSWAWNAGGYPCYQIIIFYCCHVTLKFGIVIGQGYIAQMQGLYAHNHIILQVWGLSTCCFFNADNICCHKHLAAAIPPAEGWGSSRIQLPPLCGYKYAVVSVDTFHWVIHTNRPSETPTKPARQLGRQI